jgi:selT/selW/selH-like putative selenoprotein
LVDAIRKVHGTSVTTTLTKGSGGIFDVVVGGQTIFRKFDAGRFPTQEEILAQIAARSKKA